MKRRLVKQGAATLMISLPSKWIQANNLGKGDEVNLEEKNNVLTLSSSLKENKEIVINITKENSHDLKNILTHLYRKGYQKIILQGEFKHLTKEIRNITNNLLLGFEITEHNTKELVLENISEPVEQKYEILQKKIINTLKETNLIILENIAKNNLSNLSEIEELRNNNDKYILFCRRILIQGKTGRNQITNWEFLTFLTHIQHTYYYLYEYLTKNKVNTKRLIPLLNELNNYLLLLEDSFIKKDLTSIHKINKLKHKFQFGECIVSLESSKGSDAVAFSYIRELFRLIQISTSPLILEILNQ